MMPSASLIAEFERWRQQNERGGWRCRWRRRSVWGAQVAQRAGLRRQVSAPLFFGSRMDVVTGEEMSSGILAFGYSEVALTALMLRWLDAGDTMVDVGTHFGYEALLASRLVGPSGRVYAFEPNPDAYAVAAGNLRSSGNVELSAAAVGDHVGTLLFERRAIEQSAFAKASSGAPSESSIPVSLTTLDAVIPDGPVALVKVDVEGAEESVLRGATELLAGRAPLLVLETDMPGDRIGPDRAQGFATFLARFGYEGYSFDYAGRFRVAGLGELDVGHANVLFAAREDRRRLRALDAS